MIERHVMTTDAVVRRMADEEYRQTAWERRYSQHLASINRYVEAA